SSSVVYALLCPPTAAIIDVCASGWTFFDPLNIRCSNRCAKPVRPGFSFFDPTWYVRLTCTIGVEWSSDSTTVRPFGSVVIWYWNFGGREAADGLPPATSTSAADTAEAVASRRRLTICARLSTD